MYLQVHLQMYMYIILCRCLYVYVYECVDVHLHIYMYAYLYTPNWAFRAWCRRAFPMVENSVGVESPSQTWEFLNSENQGPQCRPQNSGALTIRTSKKWTPNFFEAVKRSKRPWCHGRLPICFCRASLLKICRFLGGCVSAEPSCRKDPGPTTPLWDQ